MWRMMNAFVIPFFDLRTQPQRIYECASIEVLAWKPQCSEVLAGSGVAGQFDRPCGVAIDGEGNIVNDIDVALVRCHSRSDYHTQTIHILDSVDSLDDHGRVAVVRRSG
jgi:hypothetical protein